MAITTYLKNAILDSDFTGKTSFSPPTIYVGLSSTLPDPSGTGVTEPSGSGYARASGAGDWNTANLGSTSNSVAISFPKATAPWLAGSPIGFFVGYDAPTGGNLLWYGGFPGRAILAGDTPRFPIAGIVHSMGLKNIAASTTTVTSTSASMTVERRLQATIESSVTILPGALIDHEDLAADLTATATLVASLGVLRPLSASQISSASLTAALSRLKPLAATSTDESTVTAALTSGKGAQASISDHVAVTASLTRQKALAATTSASTALTASIIKVKPFVATSTNTTTLTAAATRGRGLATSLFDVSLLSAALTTPSHFSSTNKGAAIVLSNNNLTATVTTQAFTQVIVNKSWSSGKPYFEVVQTSPATAPTSVRVQFGYATTGAGGFNTNAILGGGGGKFGVNSAGGYTCTDNATIGTYTTWGINQTLGIAYDYAAKRLWVKNLTTGSFWNANASADPATGVGGFDVTDGGQTNTIGTAPIYAAVSFTSSTGTNYTLAVTINLGGTSFVGTIPTGFTAYNS